MASVNSFSNSFENSTEHHESISLEISSDGSMICEIKCSISSSAKSFAVGGRMRPPWRIVPCPTLDEGELFTLTCGHEDKDENE